MKILGCLSEIAVGLFKLILLCLIWGLVAPLWGGGCFVREDYLRSKNNEPTKYEIESNLERKLKSEAPAYIMKDIDVTAKRVSKGKWSVKVRAERIDGDYKYFDMSAIVDSNGDIHYFDGPL